MSRRNYKIAKDQIVNIDDVIYLNVDGHIMSGEEVAEYLMLFGKYPKKLGKGWRELVKDPDVIKMSEPLTLKSFKKYLK